MGATRGSGTDCSNTLQLEREKKNSFRRNEIAQNKTVYFDSDGKKAQCTLVQPSSEIDESGKV